MAHAMFCTRCGQRYPFTWNFAGKEITCRKCGYVFVAPEVPPGRRAGKRQPAKSKDREPAGSAETDNSPSDEIGLAAGDPSEELGFADDPSDDDKDSADELDDDDLMAAGSPQSASSGNLLDEEFGPASGGSTGGIDDLLDETLSPTLQGPDEGGPLGPAPSTWGFGPFRLTRIDSLNLRSSEWRMFVWGLSLVGVSLAMILVPGILMLAGYGLAISPIALTLMALAVTCAGVLFVLLALKRTPQVAMPLLGASVLLFVLFYSFSPATNPSEKRAETPDEAAEAAESTAPEGSQPAAGNQPGVPLAPELPALSADEAAAYNKLTGDFPAAKIVRVVLRPVPESLFQHLCERLYRATGAERYFGTSDEKQMTLWIAPIDDVEKAAQTIELGAVRADPQQRIIHVEVDPARLPEPLKPPIDDTDHPLFYRRNLEDLTCYDAARRREAMARLRMAPERELRGRVADALAENLDHEDPGVRTDALKTLAEWTTDDVVDAVLARVEDDDEHVRTAAMQLLLKVDDPRAAEAVADRLGIDSVAATNVLIEMGQSAEEAVLAHLDSNNPLVLLDACAVLERIGTEKSVEPLKRLVSSGDDRIFEAASKALEEVAGQSAEDMLATAEGALLFLRSANEERRKQGFTALQNIEPDGEHRTEIAESLNEMVQDTSLPTAERMAAIKALGNWHTPETVPTLAALTRHEKSVIARAALRALGSVPTAAAVEAVAAAFPREPFLAFNSLKDMGADAEEITWRYLGHDSRNVRHKALEVLERLGTKKSIGPLNLYARSADETGAKLARKAVNSIQQRGE
jgi:HEAT repeat protein